jgi:hypothetical protein
MPKDITSGSFCKIEAWTLGCLLKEQEMNHFKGIKLIIAGAAAILYMGQRAQAQVSVDGSATLSVMRALTLSETTPMSWGSIARPGNGTADYTLNYTSGAVTLTANTSTAYPGFAVDNGAAGVWAVTGEPSTGITYSVSIGAFDGTGVTVQAAHINGTANSGTGTLDGSGNYTLNLGGVVRVGAAASLGLQTATVTVTIDYS